MNIARSSAKIFTAKVGSTVIGFLALVIFARLLGSKSLGVFFLFKALAAMIGVVTDFGIATASEKQMSGDAARDTVFASALSLYAVLFLFSAGIVLLFSSRVNGYIGASVAPLLVLAVAISQGNRLVRTTLKGELRVGELAPLKLTQKALWAVTGVVLVVAGFGPVGLIYGVIVGGAVSLLWGVWKLETSLTAPSVERTRSLLDFAKYNVVPSVGLTVHSWLDVLLIGYFISQVAVGAYETAWQVAGITTLLAGSIGTSLLPQISAWDSQSESQQIETAVSSAIIPSLLVVLPAVFGAFLFAPDILGLLFGAEFTVASLAFGVLVAGKIPAAIQNLVGRVLLGLDKPELVARATVYMILLNLGLNLLLIPEFGLIGAALGTTVAFSAGLVVRVKYLLRFISIQIPYRELGWCLFASSVMAATLYGLTTWVAVTSVVRLFAIIGLGAAIYFAVVLSSDRFRLLATSFVSEIRSSN